MKYKIIYNFGGSKKKESFKDKQKKIELKNRQMNSSSSSSSSSFSNEDILKNIRIIVKIRKIFNKVIEELDNESNITDDVTNNDSSDTPSSTTLSTSKTILQRYNRIIYTPFIKLDILFNKYDEVFIDFSINLYTQIIQNKFNDDEKLNDYINIYKNEYYKKFLNFSFPTLGMLRHDDDPNCYIFNGLNLNLNLNLLDEEEIVGVCKVIALKEIKKNEELTISHYFSFTEIYNQTLYHTSLETKKLLLNFGDITYSTALYENQIEPIHSREYISLLNLLLTMDKNENSIIKRIKEQNNFNKIQSILLLRFLLNNKNKIKLKNKSDILKENPNNFPYGIENLLFSENGEGKYLLENQYLVNKTKSISTGPLTEEEFKKSIISDPKNISVFVNTIETKFVSTAPLTEDIKISVQKKIENIENIPLDESNLEEFILSPNLFEDISKIIIFRSEDEIKIVSEKYNKIESILKNFKDINNFFIKEHFGNIDQVVKIVDNIKILEKEIFI